MGRTVLHGVPSTSAFVVMPAVFTGQDRMRKVLRWLWYEGEVHLYDGSDFSGVIVEDLHWLVDWVDESFGFILCKTYVRHGWTEELDGWSMMEELDGIRI